MPKKPSVASVDAAQTMPLSLPMPVATLSRAKSHGFDLTPESEDLDRIAAFLRIETVAALRFKGDLTAQGDDAWQIDARLTADVSQNCVITLEPVRQQIDETVKRLFVPSDELSTDQDITLDPDTDDDPEPFDDVIDPAHLALEVLALSLDPYPRTENAKLNEASFAPPGIQPLTDQDVKPFAGLAALKEKLSGEGD